MPKRNSHQTTIRFTEEMWIALANAAEGRGVSVAQYVRDAAGARLEQAPGPIPPSAHAEGTKERRQTAFEHTFEQAEGSVALWEQGRLARERAQFLREEARKQRGLA